MILGIRPRDVVTLARETQQAPDRSPIVVSGPRAQEIVDWLTRDGDRSLVRVGGGPEGSSAYVVTVAGPLDAAEEARLRVAARAGISLIAVRLTADDVEIPYVLPGDVVDVEPHDGSLAFDRLAETLAAALGADGAALASGLPGLRPSVERRRIADAALAAASLIAFTRGGSRPLLPVLALAQARTLRELAIARGDTGSVHPCGDRGCGRAGARSGPRCRSRLPDARASAARARTSRRSCRRGLRNVCACPRGSPSSAALRWLIGDSGTSG